jgi:tetratricopeptide (TPR) repeat protein
MNESEDMFRQTLEIQKRVNGPEHPDTLLTMANLANTLHDQKKDEEAESLYVATIAARRRVLGPEHPDTVKSETELVQIYAHAKKYPEAKKLYEELIHVANKSQNRERLAALWYDFACVAGVAGLRADSLEHLRHAVENGFAKADHMLQDEDLQALRGDAQFDSLTEAARNNASKEVTQSK